MSTKSVPSRYGNVAIVYIYVFLDWLTGSGNVFIVYICLFIDWLEMLLLYIYVYFLIGWTGSGNVAIVYICVFLDWLDWQWQCCYCIYMCIS